MATQIQDKEMYINFWYPVALSDEITNEKPLAVQIMSLEFVAFRDTEGKAHVLSNTCIHRGGALRAHQRCRGLQQLDVSRGGRASVGHSGDEYSYAAISCATKSRWTQ